VKTGHQRTRKDCCKIGENSTLMLRCTHAAHICVQVICTHTLHTYCTHTKTSSTSIC